MHKSVVREEPRLNLLVSSVELGYEDVLVIPVALWSTTALALHPVLHPRQQDFLNELAREQAFKVNDYSAHAGVSERQARRGLTNLEKLRLLERQGAGPSTVYRLRRHPRN